MNFPKNKYSRSKAIEIANAALDILTEAMAKKEKVQFTGFGSFEAKYSPAIPLRLKMILLSFPAAMVQRAAHIL
jgi:bacterial DNA-binding protein